MRFIILSLLLGSLQADMNLRFSGYLNSPFRLISVDAQRQMYSEYVREYRKEYSAERFFIFRDNLRLIADHNAAKKSWKMGISHFTDLTFQEFSEQFLMKQPQECSATEGARVAMGSKIPAQLDWRDKGVVTPVKNQLRCGSCWTFSATGALEAHAAIHAGKKGLDLSEQQLVDCAGDFDNNGCQGGLPSHAFTYLYFRGGIEAEATYKYQAKNGNCTYNRFNSVLEVNGGSVNITALDEKALTEAIAEAGPVSVAFQVVQDFMHYKSGVYSSTQCKNGAMDVNHAVLAVGYGTEGGKDYYIVKNSWSANWGDNGYFKIQRGVNMCGMGQCNSYPLLQPHKFARGLF